MEEWEKQTQALYEKWHKERKYRELLNDYCHEGVIIDRSEKLVRAFICSDEAFGKTAEEAIKNLADKVIAEVRLGYLGC